MELEEHLIFKSKLIHCQKQYGALFISLNQKGILVVEPYQQGTLLA